MLGGATDKLRTRIDIKMTYFTVVIVINSTFLHEAMDKFTIVKNCGDGTFGTVFEAVNNTTKETVAIKKMKKKFESWDEAMSLREVQTLRRLNHVNIVKIKEVFRIQNDVHLVFEYMKGTILDHMREFKR